MRKIAKYLIIVSVILSIGSCEKNLDPTLYGSITTENFYLTSQDLDAATTAIYHEMRLGGWAPYMFSDGSSLVMDEVATGEWTTKWSWNDFLNGNWAINGAMTTQFYYWLGTSVTQATYTLAKIEDSPVEESIKNRYAAEVRALRAFFVYDIYRLYGPMPLIVEKDKALYPDPNYKPERPTADEVEQFVKTELRLAADALPVTQDQYGRVTKGAALQYLLKFHMKKHAWNDALVIANEIIGLNVYKLEADYAKIFSAQNEKNKELIFVVTGNPIEQYGNHTYSNIIPGDFKSPYGNTLQGWNGHRMPWAFYDSFNSKDKRRNLALSQYENTSGKIINLRTSGDIGALPLKYGIDPQAVGIWAGNDKVMDRFAEVILFKAEALNELNGPNQESIDLINSVRSRAFDNYAGSENELKLADFPDMVSLREHILKERGWEFWYEGKRREDLIRMGKYIEVGQQNASNFDEKNMLFAVPANVIIENSKIKQNPGYN